MYNIITTTQGRDYYLYNLLKSIDKYWGLDKKTLSHIIIFQNNSLNDQILNKIKTLSLDYQKQIKIYSTENKISIGQILNDSKELLIHPKTIKFDDDALIRCEDFAIHIEAIYEIFPNAVFSPFPVGLINNLAGPRSDNRQVRYSYNTDVYYTFRKVNHVGGFSRISPTYIYKEINFSDSHNEDSEFSYYCNMNNVEMFYLENSLIVEHQESTLGQKQRYLKNE